MRRILLPIFALSLVAATSGCNEFQVYTLTVVLDGDGSVTDHSGHIACPDACQSTYVEGTQVQLTAAPGDDLRFGVWGGSCTGTDATTRIDLLFHKTCVASFCPLSGTSAALGITVVGEGYVTSSPGGIDCPSDCGECVEPGTIVSLTAFAYEGYEFLGWEGDCASFGTEPTIDVSVGSATSCGVSFGPVSD